MNPVSQLLLGRHWLWQEHNWPLLAGYRFTIGSFYRNNGNVGPTAAGLSTSGQRWAESLAKLCSTVALAAHNIGPTSG